MKRRIARLRRWWHSSVRQHLVVQTVIPDQTQPTLYMVRAYMCLNCGCGWPR